MIEITKTLDPSDLTKQLEKQHHSESRKWIRELLNEMDTDTYLEVHAMCAENPVGPTDQMSCVCGRRCFAFKTIMHAKCSGCGRMVANPNYEGKP